MKRLLSVLFLMATVMLLGSQYNRAEAADEYICTDTNGNEIYLVTESIRETMLSHNGYFDAYQYDCRVKTVYPDTREYYSDDYSFICNTGIPGWTKNGVRSTRAELTANQRRGGVESILLRYFYQYSQSRHPNQWKSERVLSQ